MRPSPRSRGRGRGAPTWCASARQAAYVTHALVVVAAIVLVRALLIARLLPRVRRRLLVEHAAVPYTVAALWGGQKGSLLFWVLILTSMSAVVQLQNRERNRDADAVRHGDADDDRAVLPGAARLHHRPVRAPAGAGDAKARI